MENRYVGFLVIGIALLMAFIVFSFNIAMVDIVNASCTHGPECPMWGTIAFQTNVSIAIIIFVILIGIFLIISGKEQKVIEKVIRPQVKPKKLSKEDYDAVMKTLEKDEQQVLGAIIDEDGAIFQSALTDKLSISKVKVTRILDRLEGKGLVERRRRGMTNMVILRR